MRILLLVKNATFNLLGRDMRRPVHLVEMQVSIETFRGVNIIHIEKNLQRLISFSLNKNTSPSCNLHTIW